LSNKIISNTFQSTTRKSDIPSLLKHLGCNSWVSYSNLHGPEMPGKFSKGTSSRFGDKIWFER
jgi:hypothetical protein